MRAPCETRIRNRKTAQSGGYGERLHFCRIGPKPIPPCSPSRLVALSRCPDARYLLTALAYVAMARKFGRVTNRGVKRQTPSKVTGAPVAELVRRAIDTYLEQRKAEIKNGRRLCS